MWLKEVDFECDKQNKFFRRYLKPLTHFAYKYEIVKIKDIFLNDFTVQRISALKYFSLRSIE